MAKIVLGKPAVLRELDEENGQLTYKGQVIGAATADTPTQEPPSPGTGVDVAVVDDYTKLDAEAPTGTIAVTANKYQKTEPVVLPESEETEEGYDDLTLLSNKRITLADDIPYNEEAFDEYLQYCLQNPYYKVDYVSDESAVYHEADGYRYMRRKESPAREFDPQDYEFVKNLQEGDSVAGLYRLREIKYAFEPWASVSDSWSDDDKYIAIGAAYITDPVNNTADELNLDCDLILQVTGAAKKYALFVELADSLFPYSKISPTRYRHISFFIYCFEDLLISTEYNVVQLRKGWNIGYEICSYDEEHNEYDARGFEAEQIDRISDWLHLVTKSDGCAICSDGASNLLTGIFMEVVEEFPAGLYVKQNNWKCVASDSLAALRALETKTHEHENTDILRRLKERDGRLQYNGYPLGGKRLSNFYYSHTEDNVDVYYITVVEEYGYEHTQELRIVQGRNGQNAGLQLVYFRYASSLTNEKIMHETPMDGDDLIGLYIGTEDTAPTDPGRYTWAPFRTVNNLSFARIQQYVRQGVIRNYLNIGDVIFAHHNEYGLVPLQVIGIDQDIPVEAGIDHTLTVQCLYPICKKEYDAVEPEESMDGQYMNGNPLWAYSNIRQWLNANGYNWYTPNQISYYRQLKEHEINELFTTVYEETPVAGTSYFKPVLSGTGFERVTETEGLNPKENGWYTRRGGLQITKDTSLIPGKTYYAYLPSCGDNRTCRHTAEEIQAYYEGQGIFNVNPRNSRIQEAITYYRKNGGEYMPLDETGLEELFMASEQFLSEELYRFFRIEDTPPSYVDEPGFLTGFSSEFRNCLGRVVKYSGYNSNGFIEQGEKVRFENGEYDVARTFDKVFLLSVGEVMGAYAYDGLTVDHTEPYDYFFGGYDQNTAHNSLAIRYYSSELGHPVFWLSRSGGYDACVTEFASSGCCVIATPSSEGFIIPAMCIM